LQQNDKLLKDQELETRGSGAYKPAYKENPKTAREQAEIDTSELPLDLAHIIAVWPELPEHIKAAIKALTQTHIKEEK